MQHTGGLRKLRFTPPGTGRGKSGAYRVCYAFFSSFGTIALFAAFAKNEQSDLSRSEANAIAKALKAFETELRVQVEQRNERSIRMKTSKSKHGARDRRAKAAGRAEDASSAGSKILAAIEEATELLRSEGLGSRRLTVRTYRMPTAPRAYRPGDVKRVRELLGASQAVFAGFLGVNVNT